MSSSPKTAAAAATQSQIFLAPRSNETSYKNFLSTIEHGVDYGIVEPHLTEDGRNILKGRDNIFAWGNKETKKTSWDRMAIGDLVLFYRGREGEEKTGKLVYAGRLIFKQHSKQLGTALWPPKPGQEPWTCIFFLDELKPVYIPITDIAELCGYKKNFFPQGFMPLNEDGLQKIMTKFKSVDSFLAHYAEGKPVETPDLEVSNQVTAHAEAELLLLKVGRMLGFDTYSPDAAKTAFGENLEDWITLKELPTRFLGAHMIPLVKQIDVIWFVDEVPKVAIEVEHTTKFEAGFQRLLQLQPLSTTLLIVSAEANKYLFDKYIKTDPYYKCKKAFRFRDYKQLEDFFNAVSEFSTLRETFLK